MIITQEAGVSVQEEFYQRLDAIISLFGQQATADARTLSQQWPTATIV
jgi:hypothetical protein